MDDHKEFEIECLNEIENQGADKELSSINQAWLDRVAQHKYTYHFKWLGMPIIQLPQDIIGTQEIVYDVKPDLIIETGIARGGSLIFYASLLETLSHCGGNVNAKVVGIDIDLREHNKKRILEHPLSKRIELINGSSISDGVYDKVSGIAQNYEKIIVLLDSNHTHDHVYNELLLYAPLVTKGSYCIVYDTIVENLPDKMFENREWGKGDNPMTAVKQYLSELKINKVYDINNEQVQFDIDKVIENKLLMTVAPNGFLKRI
jgi:cephalosporin hydroxylase